MVKWLIVFLFLFLIFFNLVEARFGDNEILTTSRSTTINNFTINGSSAIHNDLQGLQGGNGTEYYHLNNTVWQYVVNNFSKWITSAGTGITWATANNGTLLNYSSALNGTLVQNSTLVDYLKTVNWNATNTSYFSNISNFAVNLTNEKYCVYNSSLDKLNCSYSASSSDTFTANYSNFTTIYSWGVENASTRGYATNASLWTLNYSTYLNKPTYAQVTNGTDVALVTAGNAFGNFNQSMNSTTFFLWSLLQRIGINTTSPQNKLNVIGDGNFTSALYVNNKNLEVGYDYAINSTGGTDTFIANYSNFTTIYGYSINDSLWTLNYSTYLTKPTWAQSTNGTILMRFSDWNATNTSYLRDDGDTGIGSYNFTNSTGSNISFINGTTGRFGINSTMPQSLFEVQGNTNITGNLSLGRGATYMEFYYNGTDNFLDLKNNRSFVNNSATNITFFGSVVINGTLYGGSPVKISGGLRLVDAVSATCDSSVRGTLRFTQSALGVADILEVCAKTITDTYSWRTVSLV